MEAVAQDLGKLIKVRAVLRGEKKAWFGLTPQSHRMISNGEVFYCYEKQFSDVARKGVNKNGKPIRAGWMERVADDTPVTVHRGAPSAPVGLSPEPYVVPLNTPAAASLPSIPPIASAPPIAPAPEIHKGKRGVL